jgi:hypothetical protein
MNFETALIPSSFASNALKIITLSLDSHGTSVLHAAAGYTTSLYCNRCYFTSLQRTEL